MPRLPGGAATNLPHCPRPGHEARRVVKDGHYGTPPRQRYRCRAPDGTFHRFTPPLPREMTDPCVCDECDNDVSAHQGPAVPRHYEIPLREVAAAFIAVGAGATYTRAAAAARAAAGHRETEPDTGGQLVAEWLDALAPAVLAAHAETGWPEAVVLDSTNFLSTNPLTGGRRQEFAVLGAYGYPEPGQGRRRVWALRAYPRANTDTWADFLRQLDTGSAPQVVVCDGDTAIANAVRAVWPTGVFVRACEWHLRRRLDGALHTDGLDRPGHPAGELVKTAFATIDDWDAFARAASGGEATGRWLDRNAATVRAQVRAAPGLPGPRSTAALETPLGRVRDYLDARAFALRNANRTNLMLGLVRLHLNDAADLFTYRRALRAALDASAGTPPAQRRGADPHGRPSLRLPT